MFVTFITILIRWYFYQIMDYRDTRAYILDPCIQEFLFEMIVIYVQNSLDAGIQDSSTSISIVVKFD